MEIRPNGSANIGPIDDHFSSTNEVEIPKRFPQAPNLENRPALTDEQIKAAKEINSTTKVAFTPPNPATMDSSQIMFELIRSKIINSFS